MGCEYYLELIGREADGELAEPERAALSAHLAECENCRRFAAALRAIGEGMAEEAEVPAGFAESVMAGLPGRKKKVLPFRRWGSLAAAAVLVIALGSAGARIFAPKGGAMEAAPAAGAEMQAAPAAAEPKMETNGSVMYAAPRMAADEAVAEEAPAAECAEAETTDEGAAFDPRVDAALRYAGEQQPGRWELLR